MGRENLEPTHFDLVPTRHLGTRVGLLWVRQDVLKASVTLTPGMTLNALCAQLGTPKDQAGSLGYGAYVLTETGPRDDQYHGFYFAPPAPAGNALFDIRKLTAVREKRIWMELPWPDVLRYLYGMKGGEPVFVETGAVDTAVVSNARTETLAVDHYELIRGGSLPTEVIVRDYLTADVVTGLKVEKPQAQPFAYSFLGMRNQLYALHNTITVPHFLSAGYPLDGFGTPDWVDRSSEGGQVFPRTNFLTWAKHLFRADQSPDPENGLYFTRTYTALPPPLPKGQLLSGM